MHIPRGKQLSMNNRSNNRRYVAHGNVDNSAEFPTFPPAQQQILCCPLTSAHSMPALVDYRPYSHKKSNLIFDILLGYIVKTGRF